MATALPKTQYRQPTPNTTKIEAYSDFRAYLDFLYNKFEGSSKAQDRVDECREIIDIYDPDLEKIADEQITIMKSKDKQRAEGAYCTLTDLLADVTQTASEIDSARGNTQFIEMLAVDPVIEKILTATEAYKIAETEVTGG